MVCKLAVKPGSPFFNLLTAILHFLGEELQPCIPDIWYLPHDYFTKVQAYSNSCQKNVMVQEGM